MDILTALEQEVERSNEFTRDNFGLKVGDTFPEVARAVAQSKTLSGRLVIGLVMGALTGKSVMDDVKGEGEDAPNFGPVILKHLEVFETPLALFYWGIQIGRRMEREEAQALSKLDTTV